MHFFYMFANPNIDTNTEPKPFKWYAHYYNLFNEQTIMCKCHFILFQKTHEELIMEFFWNLMKSKTPHRGKIIITNCIEIFLYYPSRKTQPSVHLFKLQL
jgi:hypothetical protein